jgi:hypothetical protein
MWYSIRVTGSPTIVDMDGPTFRPTQLLQLLFERCDPGLSFTIIFGNTHENAYPPHAIR